MNIDESRNEIDAVDEAIVKLLDRRAKIVNGIGAIKAKAGLAVFDRRRESEVMRRVARCSDGSFGEAALARVFGEILLESRRMQRRAVTVQGEILEETR
jgi:chorismate mutase